MAVLPSPDNATAEPANICRLDGPTTSFASLLQTPLDRVNTHAAPTLLLSYGPPTIRVLPSADRALEFPWFAGPMILLKASGPSCCTKFALEKAAVISPAIRNFLELNKWVFLRTRT